MPPPKKPRDAQEWPVDDEDMEALCDAALEEPAYEAVERFVRGGSHDDGFAQTLAMARERNARLAAEVPSVKNILSARRKKAFLRALSHAGNVGLACAAAGWPRGVPYSLRKGDPDFRDKWDFALESATDVLHGEAFRRAVHGVEEEVWRLDKEANPVHVNTVVKYSDNLLTFLLKAHDRARFGDKVEASVGSNKGGVLVVPGTRPLEEWSAAAAIQQSQYREQREPE